MQYRYATFLQPTIAPLVALRSIAHGVTHAVDLDREARF